MDRRARICLLEHATAELLESETNDSLRIGVSGSPCDRLVITAMGSSVVVGFEHEGAVLLKVASLEGPRGRGPHVLAGGCEYTLRRVHRLSDHFVPTITFDDPSNDAGFRARLR
jgi:hypothetical protein